MIITRPLSLSGLFLLVLGTLTWSCSMKKEKNLKSWLEENMPGQLVIVENIVDLDPRRLFIHKTSTILADAHDPEVQLVVTWSKDEEGLGISKEEIGTQLEESRKNIAAARALFSDLKSRGLNAFSVGVVDMAAYILTYEEPTAERRTTYAETVLAAITAIPDHPLTSIWIECMEPSEYGVQFKDIIPFGYWRRGDSYHESNKIMSLDFEWNDEVRTEHLMPHWTCNYNSKRASEQMEAAYQAAAQWASKNIPSPFYLESEHMIEFSVDDTDPLAFRYSFPYFESKPDTTEYGYEETALGHVSVSYQTDQKVFTHFQKITEE